MSDDEVIEDDEDEVIDVSLLDDDTCALCLGRGVVTDDDGDEQECDECDGTGVIG